MTALEKAIEAITEQQNKMEKDSTPYFVGEQLKDILKIAPSSVAEIVMQDLGTKGMSVEDCEKKIADYASKHRHGNQGCCPPTEADRIIREFYGIPTVGIDLANGPDFTAYAKPAQKQTMEALPVEAAQVQAMPVPTVRTEGACCPHAAAQAKLYLED